MQNPTDTPGRYDGVEGDDGDVVIYDTENDDAWIQSDTTTHLSWQT